MRDRDPAFEQALAHALGLLPLVAAVLRNREISDADAAQQFLNPPPGGLHDPFRLPDMAPAVERLLQARDAGDEILVHGDYDADGVTSAALLVRALSKLGLDVHYFIPHRQHDHYGLSRRAVKMAGKKGLGLLISVDCGVSDHEMIAEARQEGIEVIVLDHHQPGETLPPGTLVVNPKRDDSEYPFSELTAVGIAYKFICALSQRLDIPEQSVARAFLDLVCIGTIADVAPLVDENRAFCAAGLKLLPGTKKAGLRALLDICDTNGALNATDIAYRLAPRLNAVGRMGDATEALELLLSDDESEALKLALNLEALNRQRQREQERTYQEARIQAERLLEEDDCPVLVLSHDGWHPGVVGIVASKILEEFSRPAVIIVEGDDFCRGSGRSLPGFHLAHAFAACGDLLERAGGHELAGGLTLHRDCIPAVRQRLCELAAACLSPADLLPRLELDAAVEPSEITPELAQALVALEPCGQSNPAPLLYSPALEVLSVRQVGRDNNHLKLTVGAGRMAFEAIGFGLGDEARWIRRGMSVDLAHTPGLNEFNGSVGLQLRLEAVRRSGD
ncbi:single-stranded-DNA-specific exonuclease RecJ [bacterium]|nr:single-stranded-DNA-specific exonuclease RecJ [bacterium]